MSDHLRGSDLQDSKAQGKHFEAYLRQGLVVPAEVVLHDSNRWMLPEAFALWTKQFGAAMLPPKTAFVLTDREGKVLGACADDEAAAKLKALLAPSASWSAASAGANPLERCLAAGTLAQASGEPALAGAGASSVAVPVKNAQGDVVGALGLVCCAPAAFDSLTQALYTAALLWQSCLPLVAERRRAEQLTLQNQLHEREALKRDVLFEASKKLHAKIDVDAVLTEVLDNLHNVYPAIQVDLLLSQDSHSTSLPVKPLNFLALEDDICTRAFMEGQLVFESTSDGDGTSTGNIAVPLSGKQGVYGVLHLHAEQTPMSSSDLQFISVLADTAGSAFENAKLYEQSNFLINELRLINEITKRLNQSLRLNEIFEFASSELLNIFGADFSCILQTDKQREKLIVQASNLPSMFQENFTLDEGFSGVVYATKEPVIISDYSMNTKIKSKLMEVTQSRSLIGSPILVNGEVEGVILVVHSKPNFFSYENYKLLQVLSGHIGLAMTNASLHAEVRRMVITDNLTGLYVRHYLDEQANLMQKKDFCGSLIVVDIDYFKRVNDTYGHQVGDKILIQVSGIIKSSIRDTDIAARWGGEELAVYLPQVAKEQTVRIAERIRLRVMQETNPQVTVSCGVSDWNWEEDKISVESLFYKADMALYEAKNSGRNQIKVG
ncbi:diguanylate cyclase [Paenibacillus athensensis]|uniref:GGDEF domain-containing protein n=1 Tax=Paenibacillus athensensis TaxID=1967502 RepID=A0A4Y8PUL9_9BACL|nr:diguanylate cyclase [Paenibacillus athensensis]MCD1257940.1 diguanylate cyclase [Paenibacillus athensensis]